MTDLLVGALLAVVCGAAGLLVPSLIAALPEPVPAPQVGAHPDPAEGPKMLYVDLAARPRLALRTALAAAAAGAVVGLAVGWVWPLLFLVPLVPLGVALAVIDWHTRLLPSRIVLPALGGTVFLAGVVWLLDQDTDALLRGAIGLVAARSLFWLLWFIRSAGMGFGDVRLSALLGFALGHLGWGELVVGLYSGFLVFGLPGLAIAIVRRDRQFLRTAFPFGPFLLGGALCGVAAGPALWASLVTG